VSETELSLRIMVDRAATAVGRGPEARWLCEVATSLDGADFDAAFDEPVTKRMVAHLDSMIVRYRSGEPLQYVLGRWGFRHLDLAIDSRVLIPRPETELVAGVAISLAAEVGPTRIVADLGTGSGAIGLSMAVELPIDGTQVWITENSDGALAVASNNLAGIGRAATNVMLSRGSWLEALPADRLFDVIVSNPPYIAEGSPDVAESVTRWEPESALFAGFDGLDDIRTIVPSAASYLSDSGWLVLEIGADQGSAVGLLFEAAGFIDVVVRPDLAGHDRIAVGRRPSVR
jgi:release factor glutamine methyltransferase